MNLLQFKKLIPIIFLVFLGLVFFWQVFVKGLVPIPADTIVGLYHPYRDFYSSNYPNGIPFKNFLITDPVRQQYPWRELSTSLSTWNPYSFSGAPLLPNIQSAYFYPFNFIFYLFGFLQSWIFLIISQVVLASIFLYLYLRNLKLDVYSSIFGSIVFAFGGFSAMWLEWGTILHTGLWLPLILLSIDKILQFSRKRKELILWSVVFVLSLSFSLFAGHLQTFVYVFIFSFTYFIARLLQSKNIKFSFTVFISFLAFLALTSIQTISTLKLINLSARSIDQADWQVEGWFMPFEHLVQFIAPDFFGNPTTLNYWGTWNYGELTPYVGIATLIFAIFAMYFRRDKKTLFFGVGFFTALIFMLPTIVGKIPFLIELPFFSSAQPTRLIFIITFTLSVLSALGFNHLQKTKNKRNILIPIIFIFIIYGCMYLFAMKGTWLGIESVNLSVAMRNLILPFLLITASSILISGIIFNKKRVLPIIFSLIIILLVFDLFRFSWKFNTFTNSEYLYPQTSTIKYLQKNIGEGKTATTDPRIIAPNFSVAHKIKSVEGYDPIYLLRYGELISAINRDEPNISPPFGFNRIVRLENFESPLINLLGVKYLLSLDEIEKEGFELVHTEGETKIYENKNVLPFMYFVDEIKFAENKEAALSLMFDEDFNASNSAVVEDIKVENPYGSGTLEFERISEYEYKIKTKLDKKGFLVVSETFYPTWEAGIYDSKGDMIEKLQIKRTNYNFKGIEVPAGENTIVFRNKIL